MEPLEKISDTEILINYASALDAIWPYSSNVGLISYDPWEEFSDAMFQHLVVETFAYKYKTTADELGLSSLAYPWKNRSRIVASAGGKSYDFVQFGFPSVDLGGDQDQYFGEGKPLEKIKNMKFSHALCQSTNDERIWIERSELVYKFVLGGLTSV